MARYVELNELFKFMEREYAELRGKYDALDVIGDLGDRKVPYADVRENVRVEWKGYTQSAYHGMDEYGEPIYKDVTIWHCSRCSRKTVIKENFCPNCGADMKGDEE